MSDFFTYHKQWGNSILYRGWDSGRRVHERVPFKPTAFVRTIEESEWKTLRGHGAAPIHFDSIKEYKDWYEVNKDVFGFDIHGAGPRKCNMEFIWKKFPGVIEYDAVKIRVMYLDIEVHSPGGFMSPQIADDPVVTIACFIDNHITVFGLKPYQHKENETYHHCATEKELLSRFIDYWRQSDIDAYSGWNVKGYDLPYLINRTKKLWGEDMAKKFSPFGAINARETKIMDREIHFYDILGIERLDYRDVFEKFGYTFGRQESYTLDHIANLVLGERKTDYSEYGNLKRLYEENHQLHTEYCIRDTMLVKRMEDKLNYLGTVYAIAYKTHSNFSDTMGTVSIWDSYIYGSLLSKKVCVPPEKNENSSGIDGAYVKDPIPGLYKWLTSFDVASEYPNCMIQNNISPETIGDRISGVSALSLMEFVPEIPDGFCITGAGQLFRTDVQGIIPKLIEGLFNERKVVKKEMKQLEQQIEDIKQKLVSGSEESHHDLIQQKQKLETKVVQLDGAQMAVKIMMNSCYGATANGNFRYFDQRVAEAVTQTGQLTIRTAERAANEFMSKMFGEEDYVKIVDTDSIYICMEKLIEKVGKQGASDDVKDILIKRFAQDKLEPMFDKVFEDLAARLHAPQNKINFKLEGIASSTVIVAKKRYTQRLISSEGVKFSQPKIKIMGIEAVRSSTPKVCRDMIKETIVAVLEKSEEDVQQLIEQQRQKFMSFPLEDIALPRTANGLEHYRDSKNIYTKGCPKHVRASLLYNYHLRQKGLDTEYDLIYNGEKMKFISLRLPNPFQEDVIGFANRFPLEFNIEQFVDKDTQFEKAFLDPITRILNAVGWNPEPIASLESFWS